MELPVNYNKLPFYKRREVREKYVELQGGKCFHCKEPLDQDPPPKIMGKWINRDMFPEGFLKYPVHLHHCHDTGMTIGAVHARCNAVLWQYHGV